MKKETKNKKTEKNEKKERSREMVKTLMYRISPRTVALQQ